LTAQNKENIEKEFRFGCKRCGNCCTDKKMLVNVTYSDIIRIKNGLGLNADELLEILGFYIVENNLYEELKDKLVVSPLTTDKGSTYIGLLKKSSGQCYFYDDKNKKCLIYNLRPLVCRTFPFTFQIIFNKEDRTKAKIKMDYTEKGKQYCPGIGIDAPLIEEEDWITIGKQTVEEMHYNHILIEKWNEAVRKKKITPKAENFLFNILKLEDQQQKKTYSSKRE